MDAYTSSTRDWLDERYALTDGNGVYFAHQPIYGFRGGPSERGLIPRYARTRAILDALEKLPFNSFIDVGGSEGYSAWVVRENFGAEVHHTDLSSVACERARTIFDLDSTPSDIHDLPWPDDAFDVALCSETIEHVSDPRRAVAELLRIAAKAVVITVPHEDDHDHEHHGPHAHIQQFDLSSFDYLRSQGWHVETRPIVHPSSRLLGAFVDGNRRPPDARRGLARLGVRAFNRVAPFTSRSLGPAVARRLIDRDATTCARTGRYEALVAVITPADTPRVARPHVETDLLLSMAVPHHHLSAR